MNFVARRTEVEGPQGLPLVKPPWGRITAIDLKTGDHLWMVPNGDTPDEVKNHPALRGRNIPNTGKSVRGGTLVTRTLLFAGTAEPNQLSGEPLLRAYDKRTGARIATIDLPAIATGVPMTYLHNGKQYIVVAVGARNHPGELVALTLP
jgi:quinoprotein glucose dehydrogenase